MKQGNLIKKHRRGDWKITVDKLVKNKSNFMLYVGGESATIVTQTSSITYTKATPNFPPKHLCLFKMVKDDATKYLDEHGDFEIDTDFRSTKYNYDYDDSRGEIVGYDIDHAYWRVAYLIGAISEKTYERGLFDDAKATRLAALSTLGRRKVFTQYEDGVPAGKVVDKAGDNRYAKIYRKIRQETFRIMHDASELLADEFDCWKVDCIYFRDSPQNRELMDAYLEDRRITYKILEHEEEHQPTL